MYDLLYYINNKCMSFFYGVVEGRGMWGRRDVIEIDNLCTCTDRVLSFIY